MDFEVAITTATSTSAANLDSTTAAATTAATTITTTTITMATTTAVATTNVATTTAVTTTAATTNAATTTAVTTMAATTTTTITTTSMSLDGTTMAANNLAATTASATTTTITPYTPSSDMSTIANDPVPLSVSSETHLHLHTESFNRLDGSLQEAVQITACEVSPRSKTYIVLQIYDLFGDITDTANTQVVSLSNFVGRNIDWMTLKYKWYHDFPNAVDSSGRVPEMIKQHHTAQQRKTRAMKKLGDRWQYYPRLQEILDDSIESET